MCQCLSQVVLMTIFTVVGMSGARAQEPTCAARSEVIDALKRQYNESQVGVGLTVEGAAVELLASKNGSWTILLSFPRGKSCLVIAGEQWQSKSIPITGRGK